MKKPQLKLRLFHMGSGNVLLSRAVSSQVPSALKGLTSVFGMGTGGTLSPLSPEFFQVRTLKTAHPDFLHLAKNQSLTSIFPLVSLDSQFLWIKSSTD